MAVINSPNMNLPVPVVGNEAGPQYATDVNNSLNIIDGHTHTPGSGVPITPDAIDINTTLVFNNNLASTLAAANFSPQSVPPDLDTVYVSGVDLYFVDGVGNNIQITANGGIAGSPGSISNLTSPASAAYVAGTSTFVWQSNTSIAANMDFGAAVMRNLSPNSTFALTLQAPAALSSNFTITLPTVPVANSFMTLSPGGVMSGSISTAQGITASNIANGTITTTQISSSANILGTQLDPAANILLAQLNSAVLQWNSQSFTTSYVTFTLSTTHSATAGATYTNFGQTFTVVNTIVSQTSILMSATGTPSASGTLTKASGTGDATMVFTSAAASSNATFTVPANVNLICIQGIGGGGGGGGGANTGSGGASGGNGSQPQQTFYTVTPGSVFNVTVGAGGGGGTNGVTNGLAGYASSFGSVATFVGGFAGAQGSGSANGIHNAQVWPGTNAGNGGAAAATGGNGEATLRGAGGTGAAPVSSIGGGGGGGAGLAAGGNGGVASVGQTDGISPAANTGAGGGGGSASGGGAGGKGGTGGSGVIVVYWLGHP